MNASSRKTLFIFTLPLLWFSLAFIGGILLAAQISLSTRRWMLLAAASFFAAVSAGVALRFLPKPPARDNLPPSFVPPHVFLPLAAMALFLGAARYQSAQPKVNPFFVAWYNDRDYEMLVTGTLTEPPDYRDSYTNLRVRVEKVDTGAERPLPVHGLILARVPADETYRYGERVRLRGHLKTPPENEEFSYRQYLALHGIHAYMPDAVATHIRLGAPGGSKWKAALYAFKERSLENIYRIFPDPEASLLAGILLGVDTGMSDELQQAFKDTGTAHIIAISGFNITIIAGLFISLFGRIFGKRRGAPVAIAGIALYTLLVGADAAVVRAAIMGSFALLARQAGRRVNGLNMLALVAGIMAALNPLVLWDIGFQLSFAATLGLVLYADPFTEAFIRVAAKFIPYARAKRLAGPVGEYLLLTLAAQLTTLPIMAYHFGRVSLVSFIANPFILPVQPAVMILSGAALLLSHISLTLGKLAAWIALPFATYTIHAVEFFNRMPNRVLVLGRFSLLLVALFYAALLAWTFAGSRLKSKSLFKPIPVLAALLTLTALVWRVAFALPDGNLHLLVLNSGSADTFLLQTPRGRWILINGGGSISSLSDSLGRRLAPGARRLDWLVVASTQENQISALPRVLDRYPPARVLWSGNKEASYESRRLHAYLKERGVLMVHAKEGQILDLGEGASLEAISVSPRGAAFLLRWNGFTAVLPIGVTLQDLESLQERAKSEGWAPVSALLLADSGYAPLNPPSWIRALNPRVILLNVAADDALGNPSRAALAAAEGYPLLRTDETGWIHIITDGEKMWIEVERSPERNKTP